MLGGVSRSRRRSAKGIKPRPDDRARGPAAPSATFSSEDQQDRHAAASRLDGAILNVLERQGRLNPDRARMRMGRALEVIGVLLVVIGFASFIYTGFRMTSQSASSGFPVPVLVSFAVFICGGALGATGAALVRAGRAKGL
jgi:hypothetical protein